MQRETWSLLTIYLEQIFFQGCPLQKKRGQLKNNISDQLERGPLAQIKFIDVNHFGK
jgi:hypothetical protein